MVCPLCHTQNRDNAKFCKVCGRILTAEADVSEQPVSTEQSADALGQARAASPPLQVAEDVVRGQPSLPPQQPGVAASAVPVGSVEPSPTDIMQAGQSGDISNIPTQILTPQQMLAFHQKRWQQEIEREQQKSMPADVADMPTVLNRPLSAPSPEEAVRDIADYPTIITSAIRETGVPVKSAAGTDVAGPLVATAKTQPAEALSQEEMPFVEPVERAATGASAVQSGERSNVVPDTVQKETINKHEAENEMLAKNTATASISNEEGFVEQMTGSGAINEQASTDDAAKNASTEQTENQKSSQEHITETFPLLSVGALVGARYEVTQVINDSAEEHIYAVTDRQGYQHCWNCNSEENTKGDEFCNDCGAELLNAPYIMHEYSQVGSQGNDARVLQGTLANTLVDQGRTYVIEQPQPAQIAFPNGVHLLASSNSDAGTVRRSEVNEDSTLALLFERVHESESVPTGLFIVADGMGGHANGQGASRATVGLISERIVRELIMPPLSAEKAGEESGKAMDEEALLALLHGSIEDANTVLCQINQREKSDMGSTLTGFMLVGDHAYIFNVGDSRTYMLRDEKLYQLTHDHSLVGQLVAGGLIEPDDVYTHPQRNQIFRSIGDKLNVQIDLFKQQVHPGDILLSCSDGLWEMVRDPQIADILNHATDPQTACTQLIEAANANGGEDNVSAVVVFVR
jgi:serine/threonine protein phosphatase PrpC/rRNA maturation endonuclease Nob1